jgi:CDGSH-type Zn-finger protein/uncharacterized Fe-S cluster protein YjdI
MADRSFKTGRRQVLQGMGALATGTMLPTMADAARPAAATPDNGGQAPSPGFRRSRRLEDGTLHGDGDDITVVFEIERCIHARYCVLWQPHVYRARQRPWIDPNADSAEAVAAVIRNCPSGALQYARKDGGPQETAPRVNVAYVRQDGPLAVRADMRLDGKPIGYRATFCRCGASQTMPFCDNSHKQTGFQATGEPPSVDSPYLDDRAGPLQVRQIEHGPLEVSGNLEVCSGTARPIKRVTQARLCRCGHSEQKPFCDGSHRRVGFRTD